MEQYFIDITIVSILFLFAIFGFLSGFTGKILSIGSWIVSALTTFYLFPYLSPFTKKYIETDMIADITTGVVIFLIALFILSMISRKISGSVKKSKVGMLDRNLGILLGLFLGLFFLSFVLLGARFFIAPNDKPALIAHSKLFPWIEMCADRMCTLMPESISRSPSMQTTLSTAKKAKISEKLASLKPVRKKEKKETLYHKEERKKLSALIEDVEG